MSSRRVLVVALLGVSTYFYCEPDEAPLAPPVDVALENAIKIDTVTASAPEPMRVPRWRAAPDASNGRIAGLEMAAPVVSGVVPQTSPAAVAQVAPPAPAIPPVAPVASPPPVAALPQPPLPQPPLPQPPAPDGAGVDRQFATFLDAARALEQRMQRLDGRLDQISTPRSPRPLPRFAPPNLLVDRSAPGGVADRIYGPALSPDTGLEPPPERVGRDELARELLRESRDDVLAPPVAAPAPSVEGFHGAPPALRRRRDPDTTKGFDLAVRLIRRLMQRVDRIEQSLDTSPDDLGESDPSDPSATGLWRQAPSVRK